jgi:hypothetical protein
LFRDSPPLVRFAGNLVVLLLVVVMTVYSSTWFYEADRSDFIHMNGRPKVYTVDNLKDEITSVRQDEDIVVVYNVTKYEVGCFAEYVHNFAGPVNFSITTGKSRAIGKRGDVSTYELKILVELPKGVPPGTYSMQLIVYPICNGIARDPFTVLKPPIRLEIRSL